MTRKLFYLSLVLLLKSCTGKETRMVNGIQANEHQFPFFAQLKISHSNETYLGERHSPHTRWCSASLISSQWTLTAGHCFTFTKEVIKTLIDMKAIQVLMATNMRDDPQAEVRIGVEVQTHPKYHAVYDSKDPTHTSVEYIDNDIALVKLKSPYKLSRSIKTILLPSGKGSPRCKSGTIIGIGKVEENPNSFVVFAKLSTKVANDLRQFVPPSNTTFYSQASEEMGYVVHGDSGGPFVCNFGQTTVQYGITSTSFPAMAGGYIMTFTDVPKYLNFIQEQVKDVQFYKKPSKPSRSKEPWWLPKKPFPMEFGGPRSVAETIGRDLFLLTLPFYCIMKNSIYQ